jgi:outer membrane protein assembly factor BamB
VLAEEVMFMSYPLRSKYTFRAVFALLLSVPLTASSRAQSNATSTGPDAPVWNVPNEGVYFGGPAIGPDGTIYIGTSEAGVSDALTTHGLYAVDRNGRTKWKYTTGKSIKSSPVIGPDGTIYIMVGIGTDTDANGLDSSLHAIDPEGQKKWECPNLGSFGVGPVPDSPAIAKDGTIYVSGAHDLFALQNGCNVKWTYHFPDLDSVLGDGTRYHLSSLRSSPSVGDDGTVYVNTLEETHSNVVGGIYAFSPSGQLRWHHPGSGCVPPAIGADGTIYAGYGSYDPSGTPPKLVAITPDGTTKWELLTGHWIMAAPVIGTDGSIYVGTSQHPLSTPGVFFAVRADGTLKWKYDTAPDVADWPAARANPPDIYPGASIDSNRVVYFADEVGAMWAIHEDGDVVWKRLFAPGNDRWGNVMHGGFAIDDAGILYYGSYNPAVGLVAMRTGSTGLAASRWPKQAGNNQNTGRASQNLRRVRRRIPRAD